MPIKKNKPKEHRGIGWNKKVVVCDHMDIDISIDRDGFFTNEFTDDKSRTLKNARQCVERRIDEKMTKKHAGKKVFVQVQSYKAVAYKPGVIVSAITHYQRTHFMVQLADGGDRLIYHPSKIFPVKGNEKTLKSYEMLRVRGKAAEERSDARNLKIKEAQKGLKEMKL